ncbi:MAG: hypothetical protein N2645_00665 [Clostridia bacterium]|nr:hypothetical protein [Clostridia bacterium]
MHIRFLVRWIKFFLIFILSGCVVVGGGFLNKSFKDEKATFSAELGGNKVKPVVLDLAKQGLPKKLLQKGRISISTGHGKGGITNKRKVLVKLAVKVQGFDGSVKLTSTEATFNTQEGVFEKKISPGGSVPLTLELDIPARNLKKKQIESAKIIFYDKESGGELSTIPLKVVDSSL